MTEPRRSQGISGKPETVRRWRSDAGLDPRRRPDLILATSLSLWAFTMPATVAAFTVPTGFPFTVQQLGGDGDTGQGGAGGAGGGGGAGGFYDPDSILSWHEATGGGGGGTGKKGHTGGTGGQGTLVVGNTAAPVTFTNQGQLFLGGLTSSAGEVGTLGRKGGKGGNGGLAYTGGHPGEEPSPDSWSTQQGGAGGAVGWVTGGTGGAGTSGGGGGGGGGGVPIPFSYPGTGGKGGTGAAGVTGNGGSGETGTAEVARLVSAFINSGSLQIGGNGGRGGQGGQGGSGGGGGGGFGGGGTVGIPFPYGLGAGGGNAGAGGDPGDGGAGGDGTIEIRNDAKLVNVGRVDVGRGTDGGGGEFIVGNFGEAENSGAINIATNGTLTVRHGRLSNELTGMIQNDGVFSSYDQVDNWSTIVNNGTIENNGIFTNNGIVDSRTGTFMNSMVMNGVGTFVGDFDQLGGGIVAPGMSLGEMTFEGAVTFGDGILEMEIGGFASGLHDHVQVTGSASFGDLSTIRFLPWDGYDFSDIAPGQSKTLEFLRADGGITDFFAAWSFGGSLLSERFFYDVYNDGNALLIEVTNTVPLPASIWGLGCALVGLVLSTCTRRTLVS